MLLSIISLIKRLKAGHYENIWVRIKENNTAREQRGVSALYVPDARVHQR